MARTRILVTGGTGAMGSWVCKELLARGFEPVAYDLRPDFSLLSDVQGDVRFVAGDVTDFRHLFRTVHDYGIRRIVHLAAVIFPVANADPYTGFNVNAFGSLNVFEAARLANCDRVVYASARAVYAPVVGPYGHPEYRPLDESYPKGPVEVYGAAKLATDLMAEGYHRAYGLHLMGIRFSALFGPGRLARHGVVAITSELVENALAGQPVHIASGGDQREDFLYVRDAALAVALAATADTRETGVFNVGSGQTVSLKEFAAAVQAVIPTAELAVGDGLDFWGAGYRTYSRMDCTQARRVFQYEPRFDLEAGIRDYIDVLHRLGLPPLQR